MKEMDEVTTVKGSSELYDKIFAIVDGIPRKPVNYDSLDAPSAASLLEQLFLDERKPKIRFNANDVDSAYFIGVFNRSGIDGLAEELERVKNLGLNPHEFLTLIKSGG